jgi:serine protease Do
MIGKPTCCRGKKQYGEGLAYKAHSLWLVSLVLTLAFVLPSSSMAAYSAGRFSNAPESFSHLAEKLSPTVVNVKVTKIEKARMGVNPFSQGPFQEFYKRFFGDMPRGPESYRSRGAGSGVIIDKNGTILTNNHVVEGAAEVTVTFADKGEHKARVIGRDPKTDLAVLKVNTRRSLAVARMGNSEQLKVGEWVMAIGNPFGLSHTVTSGIVSAKGRIIGAGPYDDFIQTDASINPGNSGGPLFNMKGEIVGINTAIIPNGQGIGFAIPINTAKPLIPQLISKGSVTRGYIGVSVQSITPELAQAFKLNVKKGALVGNVTPGGPADRAGVKQGDVIVRFGNENVDDSHDLASTVAGSPVGKKVNTTVLRDGKSRQIRIKVGRLESEDEAKVSRAGPESTQGKWGMKLQDINPQIANQLGLKIRKGVIVANVQPGSAAAEASIRPGDVILEVNRRRVGSVQEAVKRMSRSKDSLLLLIHRDQTNLYIALAE